LIVSDLQKNAWAVKPKAHQQNKENNKGVSPYHDKLTPYSKNFIFIHL
jgi:hypothetical protein